MMNRLGGVILRGGIILCLAGLLASPSPAQNATLIRLYHLDDGNGQMPPLQDSWWGTYGYGLSSTAPNRTVGMLQRDLWTSSGCKIVLHEVDAFGKWRRYWVITFFTTNVKYPSLAYDNNSVPHVFVEQGSTRYHLWFEGGEWQEEQLAFDLAPVFDGDSGAGLSLIQAMRGLDGNIHVLLTARKSSGGAYHLFQATSADGFQWTLRNCGDYRAALASGNFTVNKIFNYEVDQAGNLHVGYESSEPWGNPNQLPRQRLNWGTFTGTWYTEAVITGPNVDNRPSADGHLALNQNSVPYMLGLYTTHATSGSMRSASLYYYTRTGTGTWTPQLVANSCDNYYGADGTNYTGVYPKLAFDRNDRPHVIFSDFSSWHWHCIPEMPSISCNDTIRGQLRYAYRDNGGAWRLTTLYNQPGQSVSPNPLYLFEGSCLAVSPGGRWIHAYGMEHIHHSNTYAYDQDATREYNLIYFQAENPLGTDGSATHTATLLLDGLLGKVALDLSLDENGDGVMDSGDLKGAFL